MISLQDLNMNSYVMFRNQNKTLALEGLLAISHSVSVGIEAQRGKITFPKPYSSGD